MKLNVFLMVTLCHHIINKVKNVSLSRSTNSEFVVIYSFSNLVFKIAIHLFFFFSIDKTCFAIQIKNPFLFLSKKKSLFIFVYLQLFISSLIILNVENRLNLLIIVIINMTQTTFKSLISYY